jgi:hypothetical protein
MPGWNGDEREAKEPDVLHGEVVRFRDKHRAGLGVEAIREWLAQGVDASTGACASFENRHVMSRLRQPISGGQSSQSCSEDDDSLRVRACLFLFPIRSPCLQPAGVKRGKTHRALRQKFPASHLVLISRKKSSDNACAPHENWVIIRHPKGMPRLDSMLFVSFLKSVPVQD